MLPKKFWQNKVAVNMNNGKLNAKKNAKGKYPISSIPDIKLDTKMEPDAKKEQKSLRQSSKSNEKLLTVTILVFALIRLAYKWYHRPQTFISCEPEQPFVQIYKKYLDAWEYDALRECTLGHTKLHVQSTLGQAAFEKTRGFVVKFNLDGVSSFLEHPDYGKCFGRLFEKMRLPEATAFVFKALLCDLSDYEEWMKNSTAVGLHLDQTVGMRHVQAGHDFLAHQVNVLYVDIARDMVGGELELWKYGNGDLKRKDLKTPDQKVTPTMNTMVAFRGDSFHQVKSYHTKENSGTKRLSLVLEQYKIDESYYGNTVEWSEESKADMSKE